MKLRPPLKKLKLQPANFVGIDHAIKNTAAVLIRTDGETTVVLASKLIETGPDDPLPARLRAIMHGLANWFGGKDYETSPIGVETYARNQPFRREEMGMSYAAVLLAVPTWRHIEVVDPGEVKRAVCPRWPGFSKANWIAAGKATAGKPFKRSMPPKSAIRSALLRMGIDERNEHTADAICVALAVAKRHGIDLKEPT